MTELHFAWPGMLLLLPLPWIARRYLRPTGNTQAGQLRLPIEAEFVPHEVKQTDPTDKLDLVWLSITWILLIIAMCRPQFLGEPLPMTQSGRDLMLAVDTSQSMLEQDFEVNGQIVDRLQAVQAIASKFIEERKQDRLGLILFGDIPYLQSPLTFDHTSLTILLNEAFAGMAGTRTAIGDTIGMAVKTLQHQPAESRVLILLTDGENTAGELTPENAVKLAQEIVLKIYSIGIGLDPNEKMNPRLKQLFGQSPFNSFFSMANSTGAIDEETLKMIADETGGQYYRAKETDQLRDIYNKIDELEKREEEDASFIRPSKDVFFWPLLGTVLMILIYLSERHTQINWRFWRA